MLLHSFMNWFNMIFKVNKSFERSTTSTTVMLLFFLHEPMHYDFQNQSYSQNQHYNFSQLCCFFPSWTNSIWFSKSIWRTNLAPYISHICCSSWADAIWIISSMWFRKKTLKFSHIQSCYIEIEQGPFYLVNELFRSKPEGH